MIFDRISSPAKTIGLSAKWLGGLAKELAWHILPPLGYFLFVFRYYPYRNVFWMGIDEGYNFMMALLVNNGYSLYTQIWSDHPPLFTLMLSMVFRIFGYDVNLARAIILLFASLLVWAVVQYVRIGWNGWAAAGAGIIVVLLPTFLELSISVVIGLPAIALASVSLYFLSLWFKQRKNIWLGLSAILLAASVLIKLFTGILAPIFLVCLLWTEIRNTKNKKFSARHFAPVYFWGFSFSLVLILVAILFVGGTGLRQMVAPHLEVTQLQDYSRLEGPITINGHLRPAFPILVMALMGIIFLFVRKKWIMMVPLAWLITSYGFLLFYRPVWGHHQLLVTVPAAMFAGIALGEASKEIISGIQTRRLNLASLTIGVTILLIFGWASLNQITSFTRVINYQQQEANRNSSETVIMRKIDKYAAQTRWMFTDLTMYAFRAELLVPPEVAALSWKRLSTGNFTEEKLINIMHTYQPELVLIGRFEFPAIDGYLERNYRVIYQRKNTKLYLRSDINQ